MRRLLHRFYRRQTLLIILILFVIAYFFTTAIFYFRSQNGKQGENSQVLDPDELEVPPDMDFDLWDKTFSEMKAQIDLLRGKTEDSEEVVESQPQPQPPTEDPTISPPSSSSPSSPPSSEHSLPRSPPPPTTTVVPVIIFCYQRFALLERLLNLISLFSSEDLLLQDYGVELQLIVSQDLGQSKASSSAKENKERMSGVVDKFVTAKKFRRDVLFWTRSGARYPKGPRVFKTAYFSLAQHYGDSLDRVFQDFPESDFVIVLEEDLMIAIDFFQYMFSMMELMKIDPTVFCVSAFNDNGFRERVGDPFRVLRTDYFPGLGWILSRRYWEEIGPRWPFALWDEWVRNPRQRRGRSCVRPEVPRTFHPSDGTSRGKWKKFLTAGTLSANPLDWRRYDVEQLKKETYDTAYKQRLASAKRVSVRDLSKERSDESQTLVIEYSSRDDFVTKAKQLDLMFDFKSGVPRTGYSIEGTTVVDFRDGNNVVLLSSVGFSMYDNSPAFGDTVLIENWAEPYREG